MKFLLILLFAVVLFIEATSAADHTTSFKTALLKKMDKTLTANWQKTVNESAAAYATILTRARSFKINVEKIWSSNCEKYQKSQVYCNFIEELRNASLQVNELEQICANQQKIQLDSFRAYMNEMKTMLTEKLMIFDIKPENLPCYAQQAQAQTKGTQFDFKPIMDAYTKIEEGFFEQLADYRKTITDRSDLITSNYESCVATDDAKKCLETFAKKQSKLPAMTWLMFTEVNETIVGKMSTILPDIFDIGDQIDQNEAMIDEILEKCNSVTPKPVQ